jgi:SAM-dependent methyltransferase
LKPPSATAVAPQVEFWNSWHRHRGAEGHDKPHLELRTRFLGLFSRQRGMSVADLGCGQGHDAVEFALAGLRVTALDFSPVSVEQVRTLAAQRNVAITAQCHDLAQPLPFPDAALDGVYAHLSLHYFDDVTTRSVFDDISRVLNPGGFLVFSVKSTADPYYGTGDEVGPNMFCRNGHLRHFFDRGYLEEILADWKQEDIRACTGYYASRESSAFFHVVVRKPW